MPLASARAEQHCLPEQTLLQQWAFIFSPFRKHHFWGDDWFMMVRTHAVLHLLWAQPQYYGWQDKVCACPFPFW